MKNLLKALFITVSLFILASFTSINDDLTASYCNQEDYITILYTINQPYIITLSIYDESTNLISYYSNEGLQLKGEHKILVYKNKLSQGTYYYILSTNDGNEKLSTINKLIVE